MACDCSNKHPGGAPRTTCFSDKELVKLGEEMLQWVEDHPEILHLSEWYTIHKMFTYNQWKTMIVKDVFFPYYEKALKIVGRKYLDKDSKVRDGISQRWQRVYFKDLREEEDETADKNAERQAKAHKAESEASAEYTKEVSKSVLRNRKKPV